MKKIILTLLVLCATTLSLQAQQVETYSAYDVNHDGATKVDDAVLVANRAQGKDTPDQEVAKAATIASLLQSIYDKLELLEERVDGLRSKYYLNVPDENGVCSAGHDYVDLGLKDAEGRTIYWATCNLGADKPEDPGLYFAWGEVEGNGPDVSDGREFYWNDYPLYDFESGMFLRYCFESWEEHKDDRTLLLRRDDAAVQHWDGSWRMPTTEEQDQLRENCDWVWDPTRKGMIVTGKNGNSIFLPAAGYRSKYWGLDQFGVTGYYWSSSLGETVQAAACILNFSQFDAYWGSFDRCCGLPIRAVCVAAE